MAAEGNNFTFGTLLIAAMAALGLSSQRAITSSSTVTAERPQTLGHHILGDVNDDTQGVHSAAKVLQEFFDTDPDQIQSDKPWSNKQSLRRRNCSKPATRSIQGYQIKYIIMTIPEPESAPLRYKFDTYLDAVDEAANIAGFVSDSFDLPWLDNTNNRSSDFTLRQPIVLKGRNGRIEAELKSDQDNNTRASDPGILLYRANETKSLLMIFLVGESPTTGVNRSALRSALDQIAWLSGWRRRPYSAPPITVPLLSVSPKQVEGGAAASGSILSMPLAMSWIIQGHIVSSGMLIV